MQREQRQQGVYLGALVINGDLVVLSRVHAGQQLLERLVDVDLEAAGLQRDFICSRSQRRVVVVVVVQAGWQLGLGTVTDAAASCDALAKGRIARGLVYILLGVRLGANGADEGQAVLTAE